MELFVCLNHQLRTFVYDTSPQPWKTAQNCKNTREESKTGLGAFFSRNLGPDHMLFLESIIEIKCVQLQFTILYFDWIKVIFQLLKHLFTQVSIDLYWHKMRKKKSEFETVNFSSLQSDLSCISCGLCYY